MVTLKNKNNLYSNGNLFSRSSHQHVVISGIEADNLNSKVNYSQEAAIISDTGWMSTAYNAVLAKEFSETVKESKRY